MKKIIPVILALLSAASLFGQQRVPFNVRFSEPYATYDFLTRISENYPDNELRTIFLASTYNTTSFKEQIARFDQLRIDYSYAFNHYPQPLKAGMMSRDLLEKNLAVSNTAAEFANRSLGIIPSEDLSAFAQIIQNFAPIYNELIFEPNKAAFEQQKSNLSNYVNNGLFADHFEVGLTFYHTDWDNSIPFELCLLPSLEKNSLSARAFINVAVCEASLDLKDHQQLFSVAIHEIDHILYDNQSFAMKNDLQQWFDHTESVNSQYALLLLNEVLATALGNGYVMEQFNGKIDEQDWYDNPYITAMAKAIYPLVKEYIEKKQPIDERFVKVYVGLYDTQFPQWAKALDHLLAYRYIVADDPADLSYFRRNYRKYSNNRSGMPITTADLERMKDMPITKVLIVSQDHKQTLALIKNNFEELKELKLPHKREFIKVVEMNDHTKLLLINRYESTTETLMNSYFPERMLGVR